MVIGGGAAFAFKDNPPARQATMVIILVNRDFSKGIAWYLGLIIYLTSPNYK